MSKRTFILYALMMVSLTLAVFGFSANAYADDGTAYNGPHNVPGTVQAEDFNSGAEKAAYHENDSNSNTTYRTSSVDIAVNGGVTYINANYQEWLKYTVNVGTAGWYKISMRLSNYYPDNAVGFSSICIDNMMKGRYEIPNTGSATTFTDVDGPQYVYLTQGNHVIFFQMEGDSNFDYFTISSQTAPNWQSPGIVTPTYAVDDVIVADLNVKNSPYNAAGDGTTDDTAAFQSALDDAGYMGGGVVWVPSGTYKISGTLIIPYNVTLRGDWKSPDNGGGLGEGTLLEAYSGKDNENGTPFIQMQFNATLRNLSIWYPEQDYSNVHAYPTTVVVPPNHASINVMNVTLYNSYKGISDSASAHRIWNIYGTILKEGIRADNSYEEASLENINFKNSYWSNSTLAGAPTTVQQKQTLLNYTSANAVGINLLYNDDEYLYDIDIADAKTGMVYDTTAAGDFWGIAQKLNSTTYRVLDNSRNWGNRFIDKIPETSNLSYTFATDRKPASTTQFYNVKLSPYNAMGNALTDDTSAIQSALTAAGNAGGGTVYMPSGVYKISGNLSVPTGVELRGSFGSVHTSEKIDGTVLLAYAGRGNASGTPFITLASNSGLRGVSIRYPEQKYDSIGTAYPWTIQGQGDGFWVKDISLVNSYNGIDADSYNSDNFQISDSWICALSNGIVIGKNSDGGVLENTNITYGPWSEVYSPDIGPFDYGLATISAYTRDHAYGYTFKASTNLKAFNNFAFYTYVGNYFTSETEGTTSNATLYHSSNDSDQLTGFNFDAFGGGNKLIASTSGGYTDYAIKSSPSNWGGSVDLYGFHTWLYDNWDLKGGQFNFYNDYQGGDTPYNAALNQLPRASSSYSQAYKPGYAFDGSTSTKWQSATSGTHWISIDLGRQFYINQVVVKHAEAGGESANYNTRDYKIQVSDDNVNWTDYWTITGNTAATNVSNMSASARYVRLYITQGTQTGYDGLARIYDFEVYGICERNLTEGKTATANAYDFPNGEPDKAVDNNYSFKWQDTSGSGPHWLVVDLGAMYSIDRWVVANAGQGGESSVYNTKNYRLHVSSDGVTFTDIDAVDNNTANMTDRKVNAVGRYVRLWVTNGTQDGYDEYARIYEFQVYGARINNIAAGITPTADSYSGGVTQVPAKATDGAVNTRWASDSTSATHWLAVDLGGNYTINRWIVKHASSNGDSASYNTKDFKLQLSTDNVNWYDADVVTGNTAGVTDRKVSSAGRYARLYITNPNQNVDNYARIYEFEVYGRP